jgi:hypothetical protein
MLSSRGKAGITCQHRCVWPLPGSGDSWIALRTAMMTLRMVALTLFLSGLLAGCGKHYWQADKRRVTEFQADSGLCIQEAKTKYGISETIYRGCMRTHGWRRVQTQYPTDLQFRGPEDEDDFLAPPDPLSARGPSSHRGAQSMLASHRPVFRVIRVACSITPSVSAKSAAVAG